ncbi:MAG: hypothetical protein ACTS27_09070, partial [Phycisphaerales bacterium]
MIRASRTRSTGLRSIAAFDSLESALRKRRSCSIALAATAAQAGPPAKHRSASSPAVATASSASLGRDRVSSRATVSRTTSLGSFRALDRSAAFRAGATPDRASIR